MDCRHDPSVTFFDITIFISLCLAFAGRFMSCSTFHISSFVKHVTRNLVLKKENRNNSKQYSISVDWVKQ